jgi:hypothetical protein
VDNLVRIDQLDASGLINAGLQFSTYDDQNVTLDLLDAEGSFLNTRLTDLKTALAHEDLSLQSIQGLGVDVIDFAGAEIQANISLSGADALQMMYNQSVAFNDDLTLISDVDGTFLGTRLGYSVHTEDGFSVAQGLGSLGMDKAHGGIGLDHVIIQDSKSGHEIASIDITALGEVRIDQSDISGLINAGLSFANATSSWVDDNVTLDLTGINDGQTLGINLGTQLASGRNLKDMGIDSAEVLKEALVDLLDDGASNWDAPWEIGPWDTTTLKVAIDSQPGQASNQAPVQLGQEIADIVDALISSGVQFSDSQSLGNLLDALTESGIAADDSSTALATLSSLNSNAGITDFQLKAQSNVAMSDELARALSDAGMMEAVPQAKVQIDAGMNEILKTPFKLLAEYGVDKVTTGQDKVYLELGDIYDLTAMSHAVAALMDGQSVDSGGLFHLDTSGIAEHVSAGLILDGTLNTALIDQLMSSEATSLVADLLKLGITELDIKGYTPTPQDPVVGTKVEILGAESGTGTEYTFIDLNELLRKHGQL